jgi:hypothetical protein
LRILSNAMVAPIAEEPETAADADGASDGHGEATAAAGQRAGG